MKHFLTDKNYGVYLENAGISVEEILKRAELPFDLFERRTPSLTAEEYFRFMQAIDALSIDSRLPIRLADSQGIEAFSPPVFASYCSKNALACLKRLEQYKPLIGALLYRVEESDSEVSVEIISADDALQLPEILIGIEFVFITGLIRRASRVNIKPVYAGVTHEMKNKNYAEFLGIPVTVGSKNILAFSKSDAEIPFVSRNDSMREFFKPELARRLAMTETDETCSARVRCALTELLPGGECTIDDTAKKLGYSKRTLQRKLQEEGTNFQKQLNHARELLAKTYLANTDMTAEDIAFLLGYRETGSFFRAFSIWTGQTISVYREQLRKSNI